MNIVACAFGPVDLMLRRNISVYVPFRESIREARLSFPGTRPSALMR